MSTIQIVLSIDNPFLVFSIISPQWPIAFCTLAALITKYPDDFDFLRSDCFCIQFYLPIESSYIRLAHQISSTRSSRPNASIVVEYDRIFQRKPLETRWTRYPRLWCSTYSAISCRRYPCTTKMLNRKRLMTSISRISANFCFSALG